MTGQKWAFSMLNTRIHNEDTRHEYLCINKRSVIFTKQLQNLQGDIVRDTCVKENFTIPHYNLDQEDKNS